MSTGRDPRSPLPFKRTAALLAALALSAGIVACGDDDEETTTPEATSAETVTLTTSDTADGYEWDLSTTPTAETTSVEFTNESSEFHVLIFARLGEGFTVDEAYELEGEKGSATEVLRGAEAKPGETVTAEVTGPLEDGEYVMLCPIGGKDGPHYKLGQLEEFTIGS